MECDNKLKIIKNMNNKYQLLIILNMLLSVVLTFTGTVSILYFIMFLYETFNISLIECFALDIVLPYAYSCGVNSMIKYVDIKSKNIKNEVYNLEKEYEVEQIIDVVRIKFNQLSRDNQIKLLNYVKSNYLYMISGFEDVDNLTDEEILRLINNMDDIKLIDSEDRNYIRKRVL